MLFRKKKEEDLKGKDGKPLEPVKPIRHRKKKEEPQKPWGKIERLIVFIFLISAPLLSILFFMKSTPTNRVLGSKIIANILPENPRDTNELKNELINETQNLTGTYGIWVQSVGGNYSVGINEKQQFDGASLFKLPLMIAYYKNLDSGSVNPNTNYILKYSDSQGGAGILADMPAGTAVTYHDIVDTMGKNSDNTAFQIMSGILDPDAEINTINDLGMTNTDFNNSLTTPYDIGLIFYKLENTNIISNNSKNELLNSLENTDFENLIPRGLPANIQVAHKYGADSMELNDAGIVYINNPYILVIMSKNINEDEAQVEIPKISQLVYDWATK